MMVDGTVVSSLAAKVRPHPKGNKAKMTTQPP